MAKNTPNPVTYSVAELAREYGQEEAYIWREIHGQRLRATIETIAGTHEITPMEALRIERGAPGGSGETVTQWHQPTDHRIIELCNWAKEDVRIAQADRIAYEALADIAEERPEQCGWPYHHDTELLAHARWVIETYWEGKEESMWPIKELVVEKLRDRGLSKNAAEAVDLVTRHDKKRNPGY